MERIKKIVGERVYLAPLNEADCEQYVRWLNDFEITELKKVIIFTESFLRKLTK